MQWSVQCRAIAHLRRQCVCRPPAVRHVDTHGRIAATARAPCAVDAALPDLRRPDSAQASASAVRRFSSRSICWRIVLEAVAVQVRRDEDLAAGARRGRASRAAEWRTGPRRCAPARADRSRSPSPPAAAPASRPGRSQPGASCRRGPRGPSGVIVRCMLPALGQQLAERRHAAAIGRAAHEVEAQVMGRVREDLGVAVPAQAASPGCSARAGRAETGCTRARRCRSSARGTRERPDRPRGRSRRPCSRACSSTSARPPSPAGRRAC